MQRERSRDREERCKQSNDLALIPVNHQPSQPFLRKLSHHIRMCLPSPGHWASAIIPHANVISSFGGRRRSRCSSPSLRPRPSINVASRGRSVGHRKWSLRKEEGSNGVTECMRRNDRLFRLDINAWVHKRIIGPPSMLCEPVDQSD